MQPDRPIPKPSATDHLANERTFLAWIRTGIGIMGFGFVVVKFSLFVKQISAVLGEDGVMPVAEMPSKGYSDAIGILLVLLGAAATLFSYMRYATTKSQLDRGTYYHSSLMIKVVTVIIFLVSLLLTFYLIQSV